MIATAPQIDISAILAAVDWRAAKAEMQRRDRKGRFAEMGGGFSFDFALPGGGSQRVTGKIVGISGTEDVNVEIRGYDGIQDGIYAVPSTSGENVKAVININPSAIPDAAPQAAPAPETPKLDPQLTPTDDLAEAKATGRPLRALQDGSYPKAVQEAFDKVKLQNTAKWDKSQPEPTNPKAAWDQFRSAATAEYMKLGFTEEEALSIKNSLEAVLVAHIQTQELKAGMDEAKPGFFDEKYSDERKLQTAKDALVDARIAVAVDSSLLDKILESGRFKSQFETKTSKGTLSFKHRSENDTAQLGYHPSVDPEKRPIYGYVTTGGTIDDEKLTSVRQYGEVQLVMRKEVEARSTYTTEDSLNDPTMTPAPFGVPSARTGVQPASEYSYAEAQMHGGVSIEDVEFAVVYVSDRPFKNAVSEEKFAQISETLAKSSIRVVKLKDNQVLDVNTGQAVDLAPEVIAEKEAESVV